MPDEQGTETGTVETTTESDASETQAVETTTEQSGEPTREALQAELVGAQAALKRVNAESAKRRKQLEAHDKAEAEREKAELSEVEKAQAAAQEWKEKHKTLTTELDAAQMRQAFYDEADVQKLSFVNAQAKKDAFTLADTSGVVTDEDGMTGMDAAVKALTKSHPHLFGTAQAAANVNATDTGGGTGKATEDQLIEYAARVGIDKKYLDPTLVAQAM
jgi:phosphohistidine swiveling domain-containing protein